MKSISLIFFMLLLSTLHAGTPGINDTTILYGFILLLIGLVVGAGYLVRYIKHKFHQAERSNDENVGIDDIK